MASGVRTVTRQPRGWPRGGHGSPPAPRIRFPPNRAARAVLGEADGTEPPAAGNGWFSAGAAGSPRGGSSLLFYKYLYFFVARYCYLTLVRGSRDVLAAPRGSAVSVCPSQAGLGLPAPPAPVCAAELYTLSFFSDVIFKTSDMPVYEDIAGNTHGQVFVFYT